MLEKNIICKTQSVSKVYKQGTLELNVLKDLSVEIFSGDLTFIVGASGSGKSTLLHIIGGLDRPTKGSIFIQNNELSKLNDFELSKFRRRNFGFVFQSFNLLNNLNAIENVALPLLLDNVNSREAKQRAITLLEEVGLGDRLYNYPGQLSGGQMQRVAICRSIAAEPLLILADEPTGNLDFNSARNILSLFKKMVCEQGKSVVIVTHDIELLEMGDRVIKIKDGYIEDDSRNK